MTGDSSETVSTLQSSSFTRREVLVASGVALPGCSGVERIGGSEYEQSDLDLRIETTCVSAESDDVIVTLSWTWNGGNGGSKPDDALVIHWPDEMWELLRAEQRTTETVRFDGKGVLDGSEGVAFRHDDAAAERGTRYAASCTLSPKGEFQASARNVFGRFAHVRGQSADRTDDWFGNLDEVWTMETETDQRVTSCEKSDS